MDIDYDIPSIRGLLTMVTVGWDTSSLKVLTVSDGSGKLCEGCCIGPCSFCSPATAPTYVDVTFSGITVSSGCCIPPGRSYGVYRTTSFDPNKTFRLIRNDADFPCIWEYSEDIVATLIRYNGPGCTNVWYTQNLTFFKIQLSRLSGGIWLLAYFGATKKSIFDSDSTSPITPDSGCLNKSSISNYITDDCAYPTESSRFGYGGSASIAEV